MNSDLLKLYIDLRAKGIININEEYEDAIYEIEKDKKVKTEYEIFKGNMGVQERKDFEYCFGI